MSRQLKFRIWGKENNKFAQDATYKTRDSYWYLRTSDGALVNFICSLGGTPDEPDTCTENEPLNAYWKGEELVMEPQYIIQQFTGKKDKAAREIYEGDIVKLKTHQDFGDQFGQYIFLEVYYHDESASFRLSRDKEMGYYRSFTDLESGHIEVVGNIFETPDLLKRGPVDLHVHSIYLDSDGSVHCYDANGELVEYPRHWPEKIENVREFARREGVKFIES